MKLTNPIARLSLACAFFLVSTAFYVTTAAAQQAPAPAPKQTTDTGPINFTAKSANVADSGVPIKINIFRWSTDEERNPVVAALNPAAKPATPAAGERGARGGRGGRGAAQLDPDDPALAEVIAAQRGGRGGAGGGGRGGRGGRGGGEGEAAKPADPIATLTAALDKAPTVGFLWTNEVVGYSIKYAYRISLPDGGERIILATDRPLGTGKAGW